MKNKILILFSVVVMLFACKDPYLDKPFVVNDMNPISTYLESNAREYSEWVSILKYSDMYNALNQATQSFTAFVPDNNAVKSFYASKGVSSIEELGKEYAFELVRYHVIADSVKLTTFIAGGILNQRTLSEDYLTVSFDETSDDGGFNAIYLNKSARVKELALPVSNGYVYVLEGVLNPVVESVYEKMTIKGGFDIFLQALDETDWADSLKLIYDSIRLANGYTVKRKRDYTVMGVNDAHFKTSGINSLQDLKDSLKVTDDNYTNLENKLNLYVAYHIIKGYYSIADLIKFDAGKNQKMMGTLANAAMDISLDKDTCWINKKGGETVNAILYMTDDVSDIPAKNGLIHQISAYAPVWESEDPVAVSFDFTDFPEVAAHIRDNGTVGQAYKQEGDAEYRTAITNLSCYTVEATGYGAPLTTYNYVDYFTAQKGKNAFSKAKNFDQLILNIGTYGSIAMQTPIIIKGRYKVTLHFVYATSMNFIRTIAEGSNGGEMEFSFDGQNKITASPYTTVSANTLEVYNYVLYEELIFDKTAAHTFKIVIRDPAASKNAAYRIQLDYLQFDPIL